jgi:tRNA A37 threonylcarbamoyladenosine biosynthesis protein TsaE
MKLLERHAQLRDLHAALERVGRGRGTTVLVAGEAGIGKTWLLRVFTAQAANLRHLNVRRRLPGPAWTTSAPATPRRPAPPRTALGGHPPIEGPG